MFDTLARIFVVCKGTRKFITVFTKTLGENLMCARYIKSTPTYPICIRVIFKLASYCGLGLSRENIRSFPSKLSEPLIPSSLFEQLYYYYYYYYYYYQASHCVIFTSFNPFLLLAQNVHLSTLIPNALRALQFVLLLQIT